MEAIDWAAATGTLPGQTESGDGYTVKASASGILIAAIDGLGHGSQAAMATRTAIATIETYADEHTLALLRRCHDSLRNTRGVAMSLAKLDPKQGTLNWAGIGNVETQLFRADENLKRKSILNQGGVVGYQLPELRDSTVSIEPGDVLIFSTDGIRNDFINDFRKEASAQSMADRIFATYNKGTDDALVLVVVYRGGSQ